MGFNFSVFFKIEVIKLICLFFCRYFKVVILKNIFVLVIFFVNFCCNFCYFNFVLINFVVCIVWMLVLILMFFVFKINIFSFLVCFLSKWIILYVLFKLLEMVIVKIFL